MAQGELHILKMAPGLRELSQLQDWMNARFTGPYAFVSTKSCPTRDEELLAGGSIYWVFANQILGRQELVGFEKNAPPHNRCLIKVHREVIPTVPTPKRAFQGWRYLDGADAPMDLPKGREHEDIPDDINAALARMGLL